MGPNLKEPLQSETSQTQGSPTHGGPLHKPMKGHGAPSIAWKDRGFENCGLRSINSGSPGAQHSFGLGYRGL